ncbi:hypothetical protein NDU88_000386 [Pleurodeles waltl]|uniref:Immunoglobulin V-set domain-containing protein n=1 Tax=Pleurodeles waltl TaxID=8319 RepID=A0AAV7P2C5_PLEWA|nr:hypothetical protein NDU88_000386 [Pleurodeles waltl]
MRASVYLALATMWLSSTCLAAEVLQHPAYLTPVPTSEAEMFCEHHDSAYYRKYWYRQKKGAGLELLGASLGAQDATVEEPFKETVKIGREAIEKTSLHLTSVSSSDDAVYFCASSVHSGGNQKAALQKLQTTRKVTRLLKLT